MTLRRSSAAPSFLALFSLVLSTSLVSVAPSAAAAESEAAAQPALQGTVTLAGQPAKADVLVTAWPDQSYLDLVVPGDTIPLVSLANTTTDVLGRYTVSIDPSKVPASYISDSGQVDLDIYIASETSEAMWSLSITNVNGTWTNSADDLGDAIGGNVSAAAAPSVSVDLGSGKLEDASIDVSAMADEEGNDLPPVAMTTDITGRSEFFNTEFARSQDSPDVAPQVGCGQYLIDYTYNKSEYYTRVQGTTNLKVAAHESRGTSHTMGIAAEIGGRWQADGTRTIDRSSSGSWGPVSGSYLAGNTVTYANMRNTCASGGRYRSRPHNISTLLTVNKAATRKSFAQCTNTPDLWSYTKDEARAITISGGVKIQGVSLTARSGFSSKTSLSFSGSGPAKICYSNSLGVDESADVGANPR